MSELVMFKPHPAPFLAERGAVQAVVKYDNGHTASIVKGVSTHNPDLFEVWRSCDERPQLVVSMLSVHKLLEELKNLPSDSEKIGWVADLD